ATIKTFCYSEQSGHGRTCCGLDGIIDARRVCDRLGIPHYVFDMEEGFTRDVIDDFVDEYVAGRTPNPCVRCNSNTKIPDLLRRGRGLGADRIATGHFARVITGDDGVPRLARGRDPAKDQTYFLWGLPRHIISAIEFPVGDLTKAEVRSIAAEMSLETAEKPESQEICFVPTGDYGDFLAQRIGAAHPALTPGALVTPSGEVIGRHSGYARYTVGQRRGLGGGRGHPLYVIGVRPATNEVVVGGEDDLYTGTVRIGDLNWLETPPQPGDRVDLQIRYRSSPIPGTVVEMNGESAVIELDRPARAVTPGLSGAVYRGEFLVGGGRIR
ncbi:MAG TPA: tRNA 2-thiouridine(34) synthase MnmA, partial [Thermomicrobiales bacterium]|nr:tRNA 2-thiouridine(34) synthase MnmA [Thermomicrobiales bacterium]